MTTNIPGPQTVNKDLLEACKLAMAIISEHYPVGVDCCGEKIQAIKDAIAKAENNNEAIAL